ncbi:helix-turn-helix domain-containing protein [Pelagibacterium luteolum]|uniref:helix-turn-helix domain-containing protein n=1 Tax=Pelagibacterium luteolum TaxID=440168 RepID=UPI003CC7A838
MLAKPDESLRPYTPETLAKRWNCSHQHVRDLVNAGNLQSFRAGRLIRISRQAVVDYEAAQ